AHHNRSHGRPDPDARADARAAQNRRRLKVTTLLPLYRTQVLPNWIDFNGHLRDAYYVLVASYAADALMDHLGMDAAYRQRTHCTLYTLEMHMHYFHEVVQSDLLEVAVRI